MYYFLAESATTPLRSQNSLNCNDDKGNTDLSYQNISHGEIQNPAESFVGNIRQGEHLLVERDINDSVVDGKALFIVISKLENKHFNQTFSFTFRTLVCTFTLNHDQLIKSIWAI